MHVLDHALLHTSTPCVSAACVYASQARFTLPKLGHEHVVLTDGIVLADSCGLMLTVKVKSVHALSLGTENWARRYQPSSRYRCTKESDADKLRRVQEATSMLATLQSVFGQVRHDWSPFAAGRRLVPSSPFSVNLMQCCAVLNPASNLCKSRCSCGLKTAHVMSHSHVCHDRSLVAVLHTFYHFNIYDDN